MNINFEKATLAHKNTIFNWLAEPHVQEFWDNSQEHKDDILNFIHGRKERYFYGTTQYWIASIDGQPYGFILSDILQEDQDMSDIHKTYLSKSGHTIAIDFCIGSKNHLGKGLAAPTLDAFVSFYQSLLTILRILFSLIQRKITRALSTFIVKQDLSKSGNLMLKKVHLKAM